MNNGRKNHRRMNKTQTAMIIIAIALDLSLVYVYDKNVNILKNESETNGVVYSIDEIKTRLNPIFMSAPVYKAVLFGSYAKGNATENSDIDIVIDSRGELININFYGVL